MADREYEIQNLHAVAMGSVLKNKHSGHVYIVTGVDSFGWPILTRTIAVCNSAEWLIIRGPMAQYRAVTEQER